jgi:hypothetical protein
LAETIDPDHVVSKILGGMSISRIGGLKSSWRSLAGRDGFGNQRKTRIDDGLRHSAVCRPRFWNEGKATPEDTSYRREVCRPRFWNEGKAIQ